MQIKPIICFDVTAPLTRVLRFKLRPALRLSVTQTTNTPHRSKLRAGDESWEKAAMGVTIKVEYW